MLNLKLSHEFGFQLFLFLNSTLYIYAYKTHCTFEFSYVALPLKSGKNRIIQSFSTESNFDFGFLLPCFVFSLSANKSKTIYIYVYIFIDISIYQVYTNKFYTTILRVQIDSQSKIVYF